MRLYKVRRIWYADYGHGYRQSLGTENKAEAIARARRVAAKKWESSNLGIQHVTWDKAMLARLEEAKDHRSIEDIRDKHRVLYEKLGKTWLRDIRSAKIEELIAWLKDGRANGTVNRYMAEVSATLHMAHRREWIDSVPHIRKLSEGDGRVRWLTHEVAARLLDELPPHLNVLAGFTLEVGVRDYNATHLRWDHVNMSTRTAWVDACGFKTAVSHRIPLTDGAMAILERQRGLNAEWVFPYDGRPVTKCSNHAWYKATARAGLEGLHWHDLRHTWASWHVQKGTPLHVLMELGGWSSYEMVLRYAHLAPEHIDRHAQITHRPT